MTIVAGAQVKVRDLVSRPDLNGRSATVKSRDEKRHRWNVWIDGEPKKLSLREENLELIELVKVGVVDDYDDDDDFEPTAAAASASAAAASRADRP